MKHDPILTSDPRADEAIQRWTDLKSERSNFEADWHDIARLIRPQRGGFGLSDFTGRSLDKPLSSAPIVAQSNFAAGLYGTLTNPANKWMGLRVSDPDKADFKPVRDWQDQVTDRVLASFRPANSPFYSAAIQLFSDVASFGNAAQYDEVVQAERKILDVTLSLAEVVWDIDGFGRVNEVVRRFELKPRAAVRLFGQVPGKIAELAERNDQSKHAYYHHVLPNDQWTRGALGPRGKRWLSVYACELDRCVITVRGYDEMPFHVPRWEVESGAICGTGPGFVALPSSRVLQRMKTANLRAGQRIADPTVLAPDQRYMPLNGKVAPGQVVYGGVDVRGQPMLRTFDVGGVTGLTLEMQMQETDEIRDAFHWSLMNLAGRTGMTATEVIERQEEKLRLMAPHMGRIQEEFLAPKIARRFQLLWRAGQLPPPPPEAAGAGLDIVYESAASMAQKSSEGAAVVRVLQDVAPLAQVDPGVMDRFSTDDMIEVLAEARGAPSRILRSREDAAKIAEARAQAQQQMQAAQMAREGAGALKDAAGAAAMLQGQGGAA